MPKTRVISLRDTEAVAAAKADGTFVRIDRQTNWGNPFRLHKNTAAGRARAIEQYRAWIATEADLLNALPTLQGKTLACWCAPKPCHGDVLAALADAEDA